MLRTIVAVVFMATVAAYADDKHTTKGKELDPPRLMHLHRPDGEPLLVVRENVVWFTAYHMGGIQPTRVTTIMVLQGPLDVRETVEEVEAMWVGNEP